MGSNNPLKREYDIVFAGGGTAACIAAGRLSEADPNLSILLVEQGHNNLGDISVMTPVLAPSHLVPDSKTIINYQGEVEASVGNRAITIQTGGILGGGSSVNFLMYIRGSAVDYDSWKTEGWDSKNLIRLSKKAENYQLKDSGIDQSMHGHQGPVQITQGAHAPTINYDDMFDAAEAVGIPRVPDLQNFTVSHGFSHSAKYIGPDGKRQDAAHRYIHPLMKSGNHPNLDILVNSTVLRVRFDGTRAVGIEYEPTELIAAGVPAVAPSFIAAKRLVVVSAGAVATPQILERSGVGKAELLGNLGIDVVSDLPGVGENYQDHNLVPYSYKAKLHDDESIDRILGGLDAVDAVRERLPSKLSWNAVDIGAKMRPTEEEVTQMGSEFQSRWDRDFKDHPSRPLMLLAMLNCLWVRETAVESEDEPIMYLTIAPYTAYPYARGHVHITSRDGRTPCSLRTGFLADRVDLTKHVWAYKKQREFMRRTDRYLGEHAPTHPAFAPGSKAACRDSPAVAGGFRSVQDRANLPPIEYDVEDDKAIEEFIRANIASTWHSLGTCKMAPREQGGVVDRHLNVYGTLGLKCADLSIAPENVAANTNNTAIMVGEKAAEIIAGELGLTV